MATEVGRFGTRRQQVLLGVLLTVLVIVLAYAFSGGSNPGSQAGGGAATSNRQVAGRQPATRQSAEQQLTVKLDALKDPHEGPGAIERNPFRFEARRRVEPEGEGTPSPRRPPQPEPEPEPVPAGPPPPPPIPLKFIGIIESPTAGRVAALSDGRRVFQGRAGDIIEGRYRIVRIGVESIVMEYADGSGTQQTIRLSGQ